VLLPLRGLRLLVSAVLSLVLPPVLVLVVVGAAALIAVLL